MGGHVDFADNILDMDDVARHNTPASAYVVYKGGVFDVTSFLSDHPGGADILLPYLGKDITKTLFDEAAGHVHSETAVGILASHRVGTILQSFDGEGEGRRCLPPLTGGQRSCGDRASR